MKYIWSTINADKKIQNSMNIDKWLNPSCPCPTSGNYNHIWYHSVANYYWYLNHHLFNMPRSRGQSDFVFVRHIKHISNANSLFLTMKNKHLSTTHTLKIRLVVSYCVETPFVKILIKISTILWVTREFIELNFCMHEVHNRTYPCKKKLYWYWKKGLQNHHCCF